MHGNFNKKLNNLIQINSSEKCCKNLTPKQVKKMLKIAFLTSKQVGNPPFYKIVITKFKSQLSETA